MDGTRREIGQLTVCKKLAAIPMEHDATSLLLSCSIIKHPLIKPKMSVSNFKGNQIPFIFNELS